MTESDIDAAFKRAMLLMEAGDDKDSSSIKLKAICMYVAGVFLAMADGEKARAIALCRSLNRQIRFEIDEMYENTRDANFHPGTDSKQ